MEMDNSGNIWLSLAHGLVSNSEKLFHPIIISTIDQNKLYPIDIKHSLIEYTYPSPTKKEKEVVKLLAKNKNASEICEILKISESSFKTHKNNLYKKLNAFNNKTAIENTSLLGFLKE